MGPSAQLPAGVFPPGSHPLLQERLLSPRGALQGARKAQPADCRPQPPATLPCARTGILSGVWRGVQKAFLVLPPREIISGASGPLEPPAPSCHLRGARWAARARAPSAPPPRPPRPQGAGAAASPNRPVRLGRAGAPAALISGRVAALRVGGLGPPEAALGPRLQACGGWMEGPSRPRRPGPPRRGAAPCAPSRPARGRAPLLRPGASRWGLPSPPPERASSELFQRRAAVLGRPWGCGGTACSPPSRTAPGPGKSRQATVRGGREGSRAPRAPRALGQARAPDAGEAQASFQENIFFFFGRKLNGVTFGEGLDSPVPKCPQG